MSKKLSVVLLASITIGFLSPIGSAISVEAQENTLEQRSQVLSEDDNQRTVKTFSPEFNQDVIYTFHKNTGILDINKNGQISSYNIKAIGEEILNSRSGTTFRAANSSLFSPWSYSSSGNKYTLTIAHASYGGKAVSKTVTRGDKNAGYIDNFTKDIDNIRSIEVDLLKTAGWELGATVIGALVSGGIGALGAVTSVASVVGVAQQLPPVYDRALGNYKKC
ncbi:geobacillin-26 family protein [Streptococcus agalactiae]|nr:geobacillin-26 family protein [Streptococcus agalactiae]